jgi:Cu(I)/Ag(I) efflux system membrane fusion protein
MSLPAVRGLRRPFLALALACLALIAAPLISADSGSAAAARADDQTLSSSGAGQPPPAEALYVCPMHPQVRSHEPGQCPICGMNLVQRAGARPDAGQPADDDPRAGHAHVTSEQAPVQPREPPASGTYVCPMHPQVRSHEPGQCPICGMNLVQRAGAAASSRASADGDPHAGHAHAEPAEAGLPAARSDAPLPGTRAADATSQMDAPSSSGGLYVCPMHPQIQQAEPGQCPICGMNLVQHEASAAAGSEQSPALAVSAAALQRLGVRTGTVERAQLVPRQRAPARVLALPAQQQRVQARIDGWVERLHVRAAGEEVRAGQVLAELYSPEIERLRAEFALGEAAAAGAAARLRRLGVARTDIKALREGKRTRIPLRAPVAGVVRAISVREGARVGAEDVLFDIDGLEGRWIEARLPLAQSLALGEIESAQLRLPGGERVIELEGRWERVPQLDPVTQTQALRLAVGAEQVALPLEAYVEVELLGAPRPAALLVPRSAVIRTAEGARVVQRDRDGALRPRAVQLGAFAGDRVEVISGLNEGEEVVVSGQFLLDAEADLSGALQRLGVDARPAAAMEHSHGH